jgi:hypothetical protein
MAQDRRSTANTVGQGRHVDGAAGLASGSRMTLEATDRAAHARHQNPALLKPPVIGRDTTMPGQRR